MNLAQAQHAVERARDAYAAATSARAELVRRERDRGRTIYAIAQELGVTPCAGCWGCDERAVMLQHRATNE